MVVGAVAPEVVAPEVVAQEAVVVAVAADSNRPSVARMGLAKKALQRPLSPHMRERRHADFGGGLLRSMQMRWSHSVRPLEPVSPTSA